MYESEPKPNMARKVTLEKGKNNMIGISIGGGSPVCPVLYVVQVSQVIGTHNSSFLFNKILSIYLSDVPSVYGSLLTGTIMILV